MIYITNWWQRCFRQRIIFSLGTSKWTSVMETFLDLMHVCEVGNTLASHGNCRAHSLQIKREAVTVKIMKIIVFRIVTPWSLVLSASIFRADSSTMLTKAAGSFETDHMLSHPKRWKCYYRLFDDALSSEVANEMWRWLYTRRYWGKSCALTHNSSVGDELQQGRELCVD
jgi:hypothetical protein